MTANNKPIEDVRIRSMETADISAVQEFDRRIRYPQRALTYEDPYSWDLGGGLETSFVAETNSQIVGFILARFSNPGEPIAGEGLIQAIAVDPKHQRKGIATRLVHAFVDLCRSKGIGGVHVIINRKDSQLQSLFVSMGFGSGELVDCTLKL